MAVETTYTTLRARLAIVPADELASLIETAHLLRSPKNSQRLQRALRRATQGKGSPESVATLRCSIGLDSLG